MHPNTPTTKPALITYKTSNNDFFITFSNFASDDKNAESCACLVKDSVIYTAKPCYDMVPNDIGGLAQDCGNSSANALELLQSFLSHRYDIAHNIVTTRAGTCVRIWAHKRLPYLTLISELWISFMSILSKNYHVITRLDNNNLQYLFYSAACSSSAGGASSAGASSAGASAAPSPTGSAASSPPAPSSGACSASWRSQNRLNST